MVCPSWTLIFLLLVQLNVWVMPGANDIDSRINLEYNIGGEIHPLSLENNLSDLHSIVAHKCAQISLNRGDCRQLMYKIVAAIIGGGHKLNGDRVAWSFIQYAAHFKSSHALAAPFQDSLSGELFDQFGMYHKEKAAVGRTRLLLCVSHYEESLHWLASIQTSFILVSKTLQDPRIMHVPVNRGNEVSSYLQFILGYYDHLPEHTLFLHGHDTDWHQPYNLYFIVHHLTLDRGYESINSYLVDDRDIATNKYMQQLHALWAELFQDELGDFPTSGFREKCCAQFVVHRERIRLRSKAFYQRLYDYVVSDHQDDASVVDGYHSSMSYVVEFVWHFIFGEPAILEYAGEPFIRINDKHMQYL